MHTSVTLTAEEFSRIHNALCFAPSLGLDATVDTIREALASAYDQDTQDFDTKMDHYQEFRHARKLEAIWSVYSTPVGGFQEDHPYPGDATVVYQGERVPVFGFTWGDIYQAADQAIQNSGDQHHIFIEAFELKNGNELHLVTGS